MKRARMTKLDCGVAVRTAMEKNDVFCTEFVLRLYPRVGAQQHNARRIVRVRLISPLAVRTKAMRPMASVETKTSPL